MAWGWRIPFLISIVLVAVGLFIRLAVMESPAFKEIKDIEHGVREAARRPGQGRTSATC